MSGNVRDRIVAEDWRIRGYSPLSSPDLLQQDVPLTQNSRSTVLHGRQEVADVVRGNDPNYRLLVIVGPCSIHDPEAALDYCDLLLKAKEKHKNELLIIMRCYLEKPRTILGWKGLINDPDVDGSFKINKGVRLARQLLVSLTSKGMPVASEILGTISSQFFSDLLSAGFIGARTTESQLHRELASGLSFPVGFKNSTDGSLSVAVSAISAAEQPHHFISIDKHGLAAVVSTHGNSDCFVVLRGSRKGANYDAESTTSAEEILAASGIRQRLMADCSHGNSKNNHKTQLVVVDELARQISSGRAAIMGVMLESNINEGKQQMAATGISGLQYGVSITDACIHWKDTEAALEKLAEAVQQRRRILSVNGFS